jgi:cytochrome c5
MTHKISILVTVFCVGGLLVAPSLVLCADEKPTANDKPVVVDKAAVEKPMVEKPAVEKPAHPPIAASKLTGEQIYNAQCVRCHGADGQGVEKVNENPLIGTLTREKLAHAIDETMPEEDPSLCVGDDAKKVADYIYGAFYSPAARSVNTESRIELSRLTNHQYCNAVTDLVSGYRGVNNMPKERGLMARYFNSKWFDWKKKAAERVEKQVNVNFHEKIPVEGIEKADEFSMMWEGSIIAEDTGDYEFTVVTENGVKLFINDNQIPLIDQWVSFKGPPRDHTASIRLLGGRVYPVRIQAFKFKDDGASMVFKWKPPHKATEIVPERNLIPNMTGEVFIVNTSFPADDRVSGYLRGTSISKAWDEATTSAAIETAKYVSDHLDRLAKTKADANDRNDKIKEYSLNFIQKAFSRSLNEDEKQQYTKVFFPENGNITEGAMRCVIFSLKSPYFLYPNIMHDRPADFDVAERLALSLWDSLPDEQLIKDAKASKLSKRDQISNQANRMLQDPRVKTKLREYFHFWLGIDEKDGVVKDKAVFPDFDENVYADQRTSLDMFIDDVVWSDKSDYRQLVQSDQFYVNSRLAKLYNVQIEPEKFTSDSDFQKVTFEKEYRAGVITHPYVMTTFAYRNLSSPIHRGIFVTRKLLNRTLKPPPQATEFKDGDFSPGMTTREKVTLLTESSACQTCHSIINPLGFPLEHFDAIGRYRQKEGNREIDASTEYTGLDGKTTKFYGATELAEFVATNKEAHAAFVDHLFHHCAKQPINAYGPKVRGDLTKYFEDHGYNIKKLLVEITTVIALHELEQPPQKGEAHVTDNK